MQMSAQPQPEHVTATATFLGLVRAQGSALCLLPCLHRPAAQAAMHHCLYHLRSCSRCQLYPCTLQHEGRLLLTSVTTLRCQLFGRDMQRCLHGQVYPGRGLEHTVRKEHMDNMTAADYLKVWKDYVSKLTHLLLALDGNDSSQARQQVR